MRASPTPAIAPAVEANRRRLLQQLRLITVAALLAGLAMLLPLDRIHLPAHDYLPLHTALEFIAIAAAFLVFATVWHSGTGDEPASRLLIATALFAAGWLDFFHALSYEGMPPLVTPASVEKGIAFWLAARLLVAATLLAASLRPRQPTLGRGQRLAVLAAYTAVNLLVIGLVIWHQPDLPHTFVAGAGLTPFKRGTEWLVTGMLALAAWRYHGLARRSDDEFLPLMFGAAAIGALGELFLTHYEVISDADNLLGHLYKFVCYALVYRAMFVVSVRRPYEALAQQTATLQQANERLRTQSLALASIASPVIVTDLEGRVSWRNRASLALLGEARPPAPLSLFAPPLSPEPLQVQQMREALQAGQVWRGQVLLGNARGQAVILNRTVTPLRNDAGETIGYVSVAENVTAQNMVTLRQQRVLQTALDGFWSVDSLGRLEQVNAAYERMSGYTAAELRGMHVSQLEAREDASTVHQHLERIRQAGHDQFESRHRHKDGHDYAVEISVTYDPQSNRYYTFLRDGSEREQLAAVKQDLERQLQQSQKVQALGQLTGGIAHDFNNILAAILGYSTLALERLVPDQQGKLARYLREVITASERARDLIARMLSFTRMQPHGQRTLTAPAGVVREVVAMMRPSIPAGIELRTRLEREEDLVHMDAGELNQVLVNLLINARDAIGEQGAIEIRLQTVVLDGAICAISQQRLSGLFLALDVADSGSGILPEHLPRLFDPFFTTKDVGKGTGLGLSMVHGILRRAGAHVVVASEPGQGSRFRLLWRPVDGTAEAPADDAAPARLPAGGGQRIGVVDDEPAVARYLAELLTDHGYRARSYDDPAEALADLEAAPQALDLLIAGQTLPGLSGLQLAQLARHFKPGLPVMLCTGIGDSVDPAQARRHGIRYLFGKPVPVPALVQALATELGGGPR